MILQNIKNHSLNDFPKSIVYNTDCLEAMKQYPDNFFDLAIVDPPYGINAANMQMGSNPGRKENGQYPGESVAVKLKKGRLNSGGGVLKNRHLNKSSIDWDDTPPTKEYFEELFRVSKNQIIWGGNYFDLPPTRCIICWDKIQAWENFSQWEMAWTSFDKPAKLYRLSNKGGNNEEKKIHPTQKPVKLYDKVYRDFATEGMKILDTHLGSGSNRIVAKKFKCDFTAFETDEIYFKDQNERYEKFCQQLTLF